MRSLLTRINYPRLFSLAHLLSCLWMFSLVLKNQNPYIHENVSQFTAQINIQRPKKLKKWSFKKAKLLEDGRFSAPVRIWNCKWPPNKKKSYFVICSAVFIALQIHRMYWPFTYEAKLTVMKETANNTCIDTSLQKKKARVEHCMSGGSKMPLHK